VYDEEAAVDSDGDGDAAVDPGLKAGPHAKAGHLSGKVRSSSSPGAKLLLPPGASSAQAGGTQLASRDNHFKGVKVGPPTQPRPAVHVGSGDATGRAPLPRFLPFPPCPALPLASACLAQTVTQRPPTQPTLTTNPTQPQHVSLEARSMPMADRLPMSPSGYYDPAGASPVREPHRPGHLLALVTRRELTGALVSPDVEGSRRSFGMGGALRCAALPAAATKGRLAAAPASRPWACRVGLCRRTCLHA
jgi:hypothetical protein